jgi:hypothetical protein
MRIKRIRKIELDGNEKLSVSTDEIAQTVTLTISQCNNVVEMQFTSVHVDVISELWEKVMVLRKVEFSAVDLDEQIEEMMSQLS